MKPSPCPPAPLVVYVRSNKKILLLGITPPSHRAASPLFMAFFTGSSLFLVPPSLCNLGDGSGHVRPGPFFSPLLSSRTPGTV